MAATRCTLGTMSYESIVCYVNTSKIHNPSGHVPTRCGRHETRLSNKRTCYHGNHFVGDDTPSTRRTSFSSHWLLHECYTSRGDCYASRMHFKVLWHPHDPTLPVELNRLPTACNANIDTRVESISTDLICIFMGGSLVPVLARSPQ